MKVFVTGVKGQLGFDVVNELNKRGHKPIGVDIDELDITNEQDVRTMIEVVHPDGVIHCAAWTAVDDAEDNYDKVMDVNVKGTEYIAKACKGLDIPMIYLSTDYVFNGEGVTPWKPDDKREPLNVYGESKYRGELVVEELLDKYYIVRTAWVFGQNGHNFINTMLNLGKIHDKLTVVDDQIGTPTYTYDLAKLLVDMMETDKYGIYHVTNEGGYISWYDFAVDIMKETGEYNEIYKKVEVLPVDSSEYPTKAKRPFNSRLDKSKLAENGFEPLPDWKDALGRYLVIKMN